MAAPDTTPASPSASCPRLIPETWSGIPELWPKAHLGSQREATPAHETKVAFKPPTVWVHGVTRVGREEEKFPDEGLRTQNEAVGKGGQEERIKWCLRLQEAENETVPQL